MLAACTFVCACVCVCVCACMCSYFCFVCVCVTLSLRAWIHVTMCHRHLWSARCASIQPVGDGSSSLLHEPVRALCIVFARPRASINVGTLSRSSVLSRICASMCSTAWWRGRIQRMSVRNMHVFFDPCGHVFVLTPYAKSRCTVLRNDLHKNCLSQTDHSKRTWCRGQP